MTYEEYTANYDCGANFWMNEIVPLLAERLSGASEEQAGAFYDGLFDQAEEV